MVSDLVGALVDARVAPKSMGRRITLWAEVTILESAAAAEAPFGALDKVDDAEISTIVV